TAQNAVLEIGQNGARVLKTGAITLGGSGKVNMQDNKIITSNPVGSATGGTYNGVSGMIQSGRNGNALPLWDGNGIVTGMTDATTGNFTSIGVATASQVKGI